MDKFIQGNFIQEDIATILNELRKNGSPELEFDTDDERIILRLQSGLGTGMKQKQTSIKKMSEV